VTVERSYRDANVIHFFCPCKKNGEKSSGKCPGWQNGRPDCTFVTWRLPKNGWHIYWWDYGC